MRLVGGIRAFASGPVWAVGGAVSVLLTAIGVVQSLKDQSIWMWLFFAALALVVAAFYSFYRSYAEAERKKESLPSQINDLHRYGLGLATELDADPQPEETAPGQWSIAFGEAPSEWWDKAADFDQRIRDLFIANYPALLSDYAAGFNNHVKSEREKREEREAREEANPALDHRSDSERMRDFAKRTQSGPHKRVVASLEGLSAARHRLGP